jgi:hypothetical protein
VERRTHRSGEERAPSSLQAPWGALGEYCQRPRVPENGRYLVEGQDTESTRFPFPEALVILRRFVGWGAGPARGSTTALGIVVPQSPTNLRQKSAARAAPMARRNNVIPLIWIRRMLSWPQYCWLMLRWIALAPKQEQEP